MKVGHALGNIPVGVDQGPVHVKGMRGRIADPLDAFDPGQPADHLAQTQSRPVLVETVVGVYVLTQQRNLEDTSPGQSPGLGENVGYRP